MSEAGYVERPVLGWLTGHGVTPPGKGLGWTYRDAGAMAAYGRVETDPIVEPLLVAAIRKINPLVTDDATARQAVGLLRAAMSLPDRLEANRRSLAILRDGVSIAVPGKPPTTVRLIALGADEQELNDYTATNQFRVVGTKPTRADTVLLVNGVPLVVAEFKNAGTSGTWHDGHKQLHRYMRESPQLLAATVFCVAADEMEFRLGSPRFDDASDADIKRNRDAWGPWLSQYPGRRLYWALPEDEKDFDGVRAATQGLLRLAPANVLDFLAHFVVFETKAGRTTKKVARYQQFEAANDIADRVLGLVGRTDVTPQERTGLIWHTQGSGKSLTMLYAAQKLRRHPTLANPTVMIVVDRRDLKTQVADDFEACDYDGVVRAMGVADLRGKIAGDKRETIVTTVQAFQGMDALASNLRDNTVLLIDEAHRSQKGKGVGYAVTMRAKLPNAFRFGLTGTPIDRAMTNTHRDFGPVRDGVQERYLSYYGIRQAIRDGATLPVYYEPRKVPFEVEGEPLDAGFEQMADEMELEDEEAKDLVQRKEVRWKALASDPRRVAIVVKHMVDHFLAYPDPSGFKAQLVCIDRETCAKYKDALDGELAARGLPAAWSDVVISESQNDIDLKRFHYGKAETDERIAWFKLTPDEWARSNRERHGDEKAKWREQLKILIVCDRLLTGFDAPVEQVMYLDKPLRDHNLLQAMARTNRPLAAMNKLHGLIVDYFGVFENMQRALNFDERELEQSIVNWDALRRQVPVEVKACLDLFNGIAIADTRDCLMACLRRLAHPDVSMAFETQFKRTETLWEAVSPDEVLYPHRHEWAWLCGIYVAHRRRKLGPQISAEELAAKTRELIREHTTFMAIAEDVPVYKVDAEYLTKVQELPSAADRAAELEAALTRELIEGGGRGLLYRKLGERLRQLKADKDASDEAAAKKIAELQAMVGAVVAARGEPERLALTNPGEHALFEVVREFAADKDEQRCVEATRTIMAAIKPSLTAGWSESAGGVKRVRLELQVAAWRPEAESLDLSPVGDEDPPFLSAAVKALAEQLA